jgi:hypothetical protein
MEMIMIMIIGAIIHSIFYNPWLSGRKKILPDE